MGNWTAGEWTVDIDGVICADGWPIGSIVPTDRDANARLISAAPDMYEALKAARECILGRANIEYRKHGESTPLQDIYEELIAQIDAAMAKAGQ